MVEPTEVVIHHGAHRFGFGDRMAKAFIDDHLNAHALVFQRLPQLVSVGDGNAAIEFAMLNERRRTRVLDVGNRGRLLVDLRIVNRILAQIVDRGKIVAIYRSFCCEYSVSRLRITDSAVEQ